MEEDAYASEPTEAEVAADRQLAVQVAVGALTGASVIAGAAAGVLAATFAPIAIVIGNAAVKTLGRRRAEYAADTLMDAAEAAGIPLDEFVEKAVSDGLRHELFVRSLTIAQDTAWREKRRALGRALANGVMGDNAQIDEELLFIRAVGDIDEMHIRLLSRIATFPPEGEWTTTSIIQADPGVRTAVHALLGTLETNGLITSIRPVPPGGMSRGHAIYSITGIGRAFLDRLATGAPDDAG